MADNAARLLEIAADPLVREAVTWQNPNALLRARRAGRGRAGRAAQRPAAATGRRAVVKYWQRYCGKNETVGFFGPSCWVTHRPGDWTARPPSSAGARR